MEKDYFEYTTEGCKNAVKFLKETDNYKLIQHEFSEDGYTVVSLANTILEKKTTRGKN